MRVVRDLHQDAAPYEVLMPERQSRPFVFNSPHSGTAYPQAFLEASRLDSRAIRRSEDAFVDELVAGVVDLGAPLMRAHFPRAFLDLNREPYELDPKMFRGRLPAYVNARSTRVAGGLGTIARIVAENEEIYAGLLEVEEALQRIETLYKPYHERLRKLLARTHVDFGFAVLIDCHSMPSMIRGQDPRNRPDIILGDRYGTSCSPDLTAAAVDALEDLGYRVARNKPYAGGFITEHYGKPGKGLHALQLEINRAVYMDERSLEPTADFARVQADLTRMAECLFEVAGEQFGPSALAAE
ncbi:MAG: N-formylglutamate amidohydrolase [Hyphomicrobiaceae bacterium]|nr:N-formylglutamate amidohydrolase [Hyphomicrobiaceae bacterium]